ncbi:MAG: hypothetical protein RJA22_462 [Verrucomicrobiota bacterium]|jgi:hypothetical protein
MLKHGKEYLASLEESYPGITRDIERFEGLVLPPCPRCRSTNTASVQVGVVGRTMCLGAATTKFKLVPNCPKPGEYFCHDCSLWFNPPNPAGGSAS